MCIQIKFKVSKIKIFFSFQWQAPYLNVNLDYYRLIDVIEYVCRSGIHPDLQTNTIFIAFPLEWGRGTVTCSRNRNMIIDLSYSKPGNCQHGRMPFGFISVPNLDVMFLQWRYINHSKWQHVNYNHEFQKKTLTDAAGFVSRPLVILLAWYCPLANQFKSSLTLKGQHITV